MSIILGNGDALKDLPIGNKKISKVVVGNKVVWQKNWPGLKFTSNQDNSTVGYAIITGTVNKDIYYSTDGKTWTAWNGSNITLNNGESIYVWNKTNTLSSYNEDEFISNTFCFTMSGSIAASGNVNSMINFGELTPYCYQSMFKGCTALTTAPELPATTLADNCYLAMFSYCTSLMTAPDLPATTLVNECYIFMFEYCSSLTTAPELPATNLPNYCYACMFIGCQSLTTAPDLPATQLAEGCYNGMFQGCSSLTTAPELPATNLPNYCYYGMFKGCSSLTTAQELPATQLANGCYNSMFEDCSSLNSIKLSYTGDFGSTYFREWVRAVSPTGTFYYNGSDTSRGWDAIPEGWTVEQFSQNGGKNL